MSIADSSTFVALAETLAAAGWEIVEFENLGGGVKLALIPKKPEAAEAE
jgi:hypothetical protein